MEKELIFKLKVNVLVRVIFLIISMTQIVFIGYILYSHMYIHKFLLISSVIVSLCVIISLIIFDYKLNKPMITLRENSLYIKSPKNEMRIPYESIKYIRKKRLLLILYNRNQMIIHYDQDQKIVSSVPIESSLFFSTLIRKNKDISIEIESTFNQNEEEHLTP